MMKRTNWHVVVIGLIGLGMGETRASADRAAKLPALDGRHLEMSITEVVFEPGEVSAPHSHSCPLMVYMLEGAIRTQVKGEPEMIYRAGQSFFEAAHGVHLVAANASQNMPAKFLAIAVCDHEAPLSVPVPKEVH